MLSVEALYYQSCRLSSLGALLPLREIGACWLLSLRRTGVRLQDGFQQLIADSGNAHAATQTGGMVQPAVVLGHDVPEVA